MPYGNSIIDKEQNNHPVGMTSYRDLLTVGRYTTWGDSIADGASPEWIQTNANGGTTTTVTGEGLIQTSANAAGAAQIVGPVIQYLPGQEAWFNSAIRFGDTGSVGNIRRFGVYTVSGTTPQDGFYFELDGTSFYAVSSKGGVATRTLSTSFTKFTTAPVTVDTNFHSFEMRFTTNTVRFYVDNILRHTASGGGTPITNTLNFPISATNINTSGATNRVLGIRNIGQGRLGTNPGGGRLSVENSSTVTLAANGVFTGVPIDMSYFGKANITVFSNVGSATDGLSIQQSTDGVVWTDVIDTYTILANSAKTYSVPRQARYLRIVYTNGATIQGTFRLQTFLSPETKGSSNRANDGYTNETDLEQTQTFPMVFNGTTWDRIRGTNGSLNVTTTSGRTLVGKYMYSSFRTLGTAATPQNIFTIENPAASGKKLAILRLNIQTDSTAALASVSPSIKTSRLSALPTGGTAGTATKFETGFVNAAAIVRNGTASDGGAATAITATAGNTAWTQLVDRQQTAAGFITHNDNSLLPQLISDNQFVLLAGEALLVQGVLANAATTHFVVNVVWEEYT